MLDKGGSLKHYGTPRKSGRYPYGSGDNPQRSKSFRQQVLDLKKQGVSEKDIAKGFGLDSTSALRAKISLEKAAERQRDSTRALRLKDKGYSNVEIGRKMGIAESSVRSLLDPATKERASITAATSDMLKKQVADKRYLDVGAGVEANIGVSRTRLNTAISKLTESGEYKIQYVNVEQLGTGKKTSIKVLTPSDVDASELYANKANIRTITDWTEDGGRTYLGLAPVKNIDSKRIKVRFAEEGGEDMDGIIQLRRDAPDLSLGKAHYAQVRIGVDGTHYLKGMAIKDDNMPDGVDVIFNTNKSKAVGKLGAMKLQKDDPDNPFGATVRQKYYIDSDGKKQLSPINIVGFPSKPGSGEEGSWDTWSKTLSSQFLSKQSPALAKQQLDIGLKARQKEFEEIKALTNPAVKARLLDSFADDCDSRAVHLKAAALPRQSSKVLIPITSLKDDEAYAPTYKNGEKLALIRHPHGGIFEIPVVTVNNKNKQGRSILENAKDAIGIHPKTAKKLSGADFDGDSVLVIPYSKKIQTAPSLKGLKDFEPRIAYPGYPGMKRMTAKNKQTEMGKVSNLITDMTIKGATPSELARAVRHSMVVIDAEKHGLNYKQSYEDNGIASLKAKYQGGTPSRPNGASTLISKSASEIRVGTRRPATKADIAANPEKLKGVVRRNDYSIDPKTGKRVYVDRTDDFYINKKGKPVRRQIKTTRMNETEDARSLSSGTIIEEVYANYANSMKSLANRARLESINTPRQKYSPASKKAYKNEVESLKAKLKIAKSNKPLERQAQLLANKVVATKKAANPKMTASEIKKIKGQALEEARLRTGAKKQRIHITNDEWNAIQSGAISHNLLTQILNNTDLDHVKELATPRTHKVMPESKRIKAANLLANGYTQAEVASRLGVSVSSLAKAMKGEEN